MAISILPTLYSLLLLAVFIPLYFSSREDTKRNHSRHKKKHLVGLLAPVALSSQLATMFCFVALTTALQRLKFTEPRTSIAAWSRLSTKRRRSDDRQKDAPGDPRASAASPRSFALRISG